MVCLSFRNFLWLFNPGQHLCYVTGFEQIKMVQCEILKFVRIYKVIDDVINAFHLGNALYRLRNSAELKCRELLDQT